MLCKHITGLNPVGANIDFLDTEWSGMQAPNLKFQECRLIWRGLRGRIVIIFLKFVVNSYLN